MISPGRPPSRRRFLEQSVAAASALACPLWSPAGVLGLGGRPGANERIRIAVVGMGARGRNLIGNLPATARVTAICDSSRSRLAGTFAPDGKFVDILAGFLAEDAKACKTYQDFRRLLDAEKLDGLMVATPDHNHALVAMHALAAGLDVYLEKPLTLTIAEGRAVVEAVRRSARVVQVGSQQRTMELNRYACELVRDGVLGKISHVSVRNYPGPVADLELPVEDVPADLDWELFSGPRPLRPYHHRRWVKDEFEVDGLLWRGWDIFRDYSGHLTTNWGAHHLDMVQYALGRDDTGPVEVRLERPADVRALAAEFADMTPLPADLGNGGAGERRFWPVTMRYAGGVEMRFTHGEKCATFHGERGTLFVTRNLFRADPPELARDAPDPGLAEKWRGPGHVARPHVENWLVCMSSRGTPNAPVEAGHRTNTVCLLANIARELGRSLRWDPERERFAGDEEADLLLDRPRRKGFELPAV